MPQACSRQHLAGYSEAWKRLNSAVSGSSRLRTNAIDLDVMEELWAACVADHSKSTFPASVRSPPPASIKTTKISLSTSFFAGRETNSSTDDDDSREVAARRTTRRPDRVRSPIVYLTATRLPHRPTTNGQPSTPDSPDWPVVRSYLGRTRCR